MASFSRLCLVVALVLAGLFDSTSAIVYNYTNFFAPPAGCSIATDANNNVFVGICSTQTIIKLVGTTLTLSTDSFNTNIGTTLAPYTSNANNILQFDQMGVSSTGTVWFLDIYNQRILGVDGAAGQTVSQINLASVGGALAIGVSIYSPYVWAVTPGAPTGTATVVGYDPTNSNAVVTTIGTVTDSTNLPSTYFALGVEPDPTNTYLYVGGCNVVTAGSLVYEPGQGFEYETAPGLFYPCDIRVVQITTGKVVLPTLTVSPASQAAVGNNNSFFQQISVRATTTNINSPYPAGTIYAGDTANGVLYAFSNSTYQQIFSNNSISTAPAFYTNGGIVVLSANSLNVQNYGANGVSYPISNITFGYPYFIATGPGGSPVYVSSEVAGPVAIMTNSRPPTITGYIAQSLTSPNGLVTDNSGNLYVIDGATNIGYKFTPSGQQLFTFTYPNSGIGAGLCVDPNNGNIYVPADNLTTGAATGSGYVLVFSNTGTFLNVIGQAITYPWTCYVLPNGNVIANSANIPGYVFNINPTTGNYTSFTAPASLQSNFETLGMAVSPDGRIFIASVNLGIYIFSQSGQYIDVISSPQEDIYAYSLAYTTGGGGLLYACDLFNDRVVTFAVGTSGPGSSDSSRTVSSLAITAAITIAALLFTLVISA